MPFIDTTGAANLEEAIEELSEKGVRFAVAGAKGPLRAMFDRTGLTKKIDPTLIFPTVGSAVGALTRSEQTAGRLS
jgi:anti-anti-sigma regulatory factor